MSWFVETDMFRFKVNIKEKPCNRRGILSVVSVVYDLLYMAAPFVLPGFRSGLMQKRPRLG